MPDDNVVPLPPAPQLNRSGYSSVTYGDPNPAGFPSSAEQFNSAAVGVITGLAALLEPTLSQAAGAAGHDARLICSLVRTQVAMGRRIAELEAQLLAQQQPQTPEPPKAISVAEAARLVGRTEACVRSWCAVYGIGIKIDGRHWKVSRSLLRALLVDRHGEDVLPHGLR